MSPSGIIVGDFVQVAYASRTVVMRPSKIEVKPATAPESESKKS